MSPRGISTLSITCITPLLVATSAAVTLASLTMTPDVRSNVRSCPLTVSAVIPSLSALDATSPETTWYSRILASAALPSGVSIDARSMPASVNAWSVGANTVKGPGPCSVSSNSACITAATKESCVPVHCAVLGISLGVSLGVSTLSIT